MLSLRRGTVARRLRVLTRLAREQVRRRESLRHSAAALASIRAGVEAAGIDPADNPGLRHFAGADRALAELGDSEELRRIDAEFIAADPVLATDETLAATAAARAFGFLGLPPPEPGAGSPIAWYAWSLAARVRPSADPSRAPPPDPPDAPVG